MSNVTLKLDDPHTGIHTHETGSRADMELLVKGCFPHAVIDEDGTIWASARSKKEGTWALGTLTDEGKVASTSKSKKAVSRKPNKRKARTPKVKTDGDSEAKVE